MSHSPYSDADGASDDLSADLSDTLSHMRKTRSTSSDEEQSLHSRSSSRFRAFTSRSPPRIEVDEVTPLLRYPGGFTGSENIKPASSPLRPSLLTTKRSTYTSKNGPCRKSNASSFFTGHSTLRKLSESFQNSPYQVGNDRLWYDQFTSVDWIHDAVADSFRSEELHARKGFRGKVLVWFDAAEGWVIAGIIGFITACVAYFIVISERAIFDLKFGHCARGLFKSRRECCGTGTFAHCDQWITWSQLLGNANQGIDFLSYIIWMVVLASLSCLLTLTTQLVAPSTALVRPNKSAAGQLDTFSDADVVNPHFHPPKVMYAAAGSGVAEVRVILSGFILHGFLGLKTLVIKTLALILSLNSGLSLGKEGPLVHIGSCVGNVVGRLFPKYGTNEGKLRELVSAAAASGVAVAFGAPISGVLFSLEDVSYYFPKQTLFRTFFCSLTAALSLKFLNPYSNGQIVLFQVHYDKEWNYLGLIMFMILGALGGAIGALFVKASRIWARTFRRISFIKDSPVTEVVLIALVSGAICFWNRYTSLPAAELLLQLASPCRGKFERSTGLCPEKEDIPSVIGHLLAALAIKALLTTITFGTKMPAGIYIPSMVVGGLLGRTVGHGVQYFAVHYPHAGIFSRCSAVDGNIEGCVVPGTYALLAAGATMCGVTRLTVTLAVILFELTGSLNYVLPFSVTIFVAKWTADAIEPLSIYDLLTQTNSYPYLEHRGRSHLTGQLDDITASSSDQRVIDITNTPLIPSRSLRSKLNYLQSRGELDGGLPIVKDNMLIGSIPCPDLEFALDQIDDGDGELRLCLMPSQARQEPDGNAALGLARDRTDLRPFVDLAPVALDVHAPMELVYECFAKLGLRYICVLRNGHYAGMLHKKAFVQYMQELSE